MTITTHPVTPEEVMAFLDGELSHADAQVVSAHLDDCAECAGVAEQFRNLSQSLSEWEVPAVSSMLDESVREAAATKTAKPVRTIQLSFWNWRLWVIGGGGTVVAATLLLAFLSTVGSEHHRMMNYLEPQAAMEAQKEKSGDYIQPRLENKVAAPSESRASGAIAGTETLYDYEGNGGLVNPAPPPLRGLADKTSVYAGGGGAPAVERRRVDHKDSQPASAPMIARTVSLIIQVKDFAASRAALDATLARHHGYSAQLTVNTPENAPRDFHASLRVPAPELLLAINELKTLGRVENESLSGEEVTQQHVDLVARLKNSRETEVRLQAILQQRTGKIEDVLQVEEEIARVRGEIEGMESDQTALEHRVDFATIDLQLTEEYKAQLNAPDTSVSTRMHNSFVAGFHNASETVLGVVLFVEEYGPTILIWLMILGLPALFVWRRYKRMHSRF